MAIDFVQPGDTPKQKPTGQPLPKYGIDYSTPQDDVTSSGRHIGGSPQAAMPSMQNRVMSASSQTPSVPKSAMPMQSHVAIHSTEERHLPPPPPAPQHLVATAPSLPNQTAAPIPVPTQSTQPAPMQPRMPAPVTSSAPTAQPMSAPVVKPTTPVAPAWTMPPVPTTPTPVPAQPMPVAQAPAAPVVHVPVMPAAPQPIAQVAMPHAQLTAVGEIVSQNVSNVKGETTNPGLRSDAGLDVNLLPYFTNQPNSEGNALRRFMRTMALTVSGIALVYIGMVGYATWFRLQTQASFLELSEVDRQINTYVPLQQKVSNTATTLDSVQQLFEEHVYWTNWFRFLETNTLPNVTYSNFSGNTSGVMTLEATAPDYATVTAQVAKLRTLPNLTSVTATTATLAGGEDNAAAEVQFTLSLNVQPGLLHYASAYAQPE